MDNFELVSEYAPTGDQPQAIAELVRALGKEINLRHCWASPVPAKHSPWQTSSRP